MENGAHNTLVRVLADALSRVLPGRCDRRREFLVAVAVANIEPEAEPGDADAHPHHEDDNWELPPDEDRAAPAPAEQQPEEQGAGISMPPPASPVQQGLQEPAEAAEIPPAPRYWCTEWGKRYHTDHNCWGLRDAKRVLALRDRGTRPDLSPCKLCARAR